MDMKMLKVANIEYIENIYALAINKYNKTKNIELKKLIDELNSLEDKIRIEEDEELLRNYLLTSNNLISRIEGVINE